MIPKGSGSIRGFHSLNTRPGSQTQSEVLRRMYVLACEEEHLKNKKEWLKRQKEQTLRRLKEIWHVLSFLRGRVETQQKIIDSKGENNPKFHRLGLKY